MKKRWFSVMATCLLLGAFGVSQVSAEEQGALKEASSTKRYALVVAHNGSVDQGVKPLRYADDDGARYHEMFQALSDRSILLTTLDADSQRVFPKIASQTLPATKSQLTQSVAQIKAQLAQDKAAGFQTEVYLVFTGHGNVDSSGEGYLSLADAKLRRSELYRDVIQPLSGASFTHLIIDACHAYFMVQSRGGKEKAWKDDRSGQRRTEQWQAYLKGEDKLKGTRPSTLGVILSTAGTAEVHEWSKFRSGVFSHQLRSGLLGAADVNGDGSIEYLELEAFLAAANAGVTNPKARIKVFASPPSQDRRRALVSLSQYKSATTLKLQGAQRWHLEDARGLRYADMHLDGVQDRHMVLLRQPVGGRSYYLRRGEQAQAEVPLSAQEVSVGMLAFTEVDSQSRSSVEEAFRTSLFTMPFGSGFYTGYMAGRDRYEGAGETVIETVERPSASAWKWGASYRALASGLEYATVEHVLTPRVQYMHESGWSVGPYGQVGFSTTDGVQGLRGGLGVEGGYRLQLGQVSAGPVVRFGQQMLLVSDDQACSKGCADLLSSHLEGNMEFGMMWGGVEGFATLGISGDWTTRVSSTGNNSAFVWSPGFGVGAKF